jgi:hypothetical protein
MRTPEATEYERKEEMVHVPDTDGEKAGCGMCDIAVRKRITHPNPR